MRGVRQRVAAAGLAAMAVVWLSAGAAVDATSPEAVGRLLKSTDTSWTVGEQGYGGPADGTWTYALSPKPAPDDCRVTCRLKLVKPANRRDGMEMGAFKWYYAMEDLGGYEAAVIVRHTSARKHYRVMVSSLWKELALWRPTGGVVQVVDFPFKAGQAYELSVACRGSNIVVAVDGQRLVDWWDTADASLAGQVGLARKEGESYFSSLKVEPLPAQTGTAPPHTPNLQERTWHGQRFFFDGNEPVFCLTNRNVLDQMKFKPGYRAAMYTCNNIKDWNRFNPEKIVQSKVIETGKRLVLDVVATDARTKSNIPVATHLVVTYDAKTGMYVYDQTCTVDLPAGEAAKVSPGWDHGDPCFLGGVGHANTRDPNAFKPLYRWSIFQADDGNYYKVPLNHNGHYWGKAETNGGPIYPQDGIWMAVGDPVVNPLMKVADLPDRFAKVSVGHCGWAYDMHMIFEPRKVEGRIQPGRYASRILYTAMGGQQADALLAKAGFYKPADLDVKVPLFRAGLGGVEKFDTIVTLATPHTEYKIWAGVIDKTVGHGDNSSLRLDGPSDAWTLTGGSYFVQNYQDRNLVSFYVKTRDVTGEGPTIGFARLDAKGEIYYTGITGTHDWTKVEFVAGEKIKYFGVHVIFRNAGGGTVWIDDFKIQPLAKGQTTDVPPGKTYPINPEDKELILNWGEKGGADTVLDTSGYGHHGKIYGEAGWVTDGGRKVLELDGKTYLWPLQTPNIKLQPPYSMVFDIKPGAGGYLFAHGWGYYYYLQGSGPKFGIGYQTQATKIVSSKPFLDADRWQRLVMVAADDQIKLYRDGQFVEALPAKLAPIQWALHMASTWHRHVSLFGSGPGFMTLRDKPGGQRCIKGRVAAVRFYDRALTADEVAKLGGVAAPAK